MSAFMPDRYIQIDVTHVAADTVTCLMRTGERCVKVYMSVYDYNELIRDGFFIRDGVGKDSAGVLNTTKVFIPQT